MNTDITRGPKLCPSCGRENPPTAARCSLCSTRLDAAIQTTPTPAWGEVHLPSLPDEDQASRPPLKGCAAVAAAVGVGFLFLASFPVTFIIVGTATAVTVRWLDPQLLDPTGGCLVGCPVGLLAAVFVVIFVYIILRRCGWR